MIALYCKGGSYWRLDDWLGPESEGWKKRVRWEREEPYPQRSEAHRSPASPPSIMSSWKCPAAPIPPQWISQPHLQRWQPPGKSNTGSRICLGQDETVTWAQWKTWTPKDQITKHPKRAEPCAVLQCKKGAAWIDYSSVHHRSFIGRKTLQSETSLGQFRVDYRLHIASAQRYEE